MLSAKRMLSTLLAVLLLITTLPLASAAEETAVSPAVKGAFAAEVGGMVYVSLYTGSDRALYGVSAAPGGELSRLDQSQDIGDLVPANGQLYYIRRTGTAGQIMKLGADATPQVLAEFENGVEVSHLSFYDGILYVLVGNLLYIVDPDNGDSVQLCDETLDDYAIASDVIFYASAAAAKSYERSVTGSDTPVSQSAGTLWMMSILGTNPEKLLDAGVTDLRAYADNLFFHNLEDNYVMGGTDNMWLEGKLYRYNTQTAQMASMNLDYDWDFYPTASGLLVYSSQNISVYPLTGGEAVQIMTPEARTDVSAWGDNAVVYEYVSQKLTLLPLGGGAETVLSDDSDVLPNVAAAAGADGLVVDDTDAADPAADADGDAAGDGANAEDAADQTYDDENDTTSAGTDSTYIFPNSSKKKLTRAQILNISKSNWGYARNEIWARHGYVFKNSKYANYFAKKSWYEPGGFSTSQLNSIEWHNMELIKSLEREYGLLEGTGTTSSISASSSSSAKNNYYVLKEASSKRLSKSYIRKKLGSKSKYALARNEILARHGYVFKTQKYRSYFKNQKWYSAGGYSSSDLSNTEWHNIEILKELENE